MLCLDTTLLTIKNTNFAVGNLSGLASETDNGHLKRFGAHLQALRKQRNLSFRKMALKCNLEYSDIQRYEKGEINMTFMSLVELAKGLEVPLKELVDF